MQELVQVLKLSHHSRNERSSLEVRKLRDFDFIAPSHLSGSSSSGAQ